MQKYNLLNQTMPHALEFEDSLITSCLLGYSREVVDLLLPEDFYKSAHQQIFSVICDLIKEGTKIDLPLVADALKRAGKLASIGGATYLAKLVDSVPVALDSSVELYAQKIKDTAKLRGAIRLSQDIIQGCLDDSAESGKILKAAREKLRYLIDEPAEEPNKWDRARELFPRIPFPWHILPAQITESLKELALSHATSPLSLPGACMAIFASVLGPTVNVSPKKSWREPLILWFVDIRPSGCGKTPAARALCGVLYEAQARAVKDFKQKLEENQAIKKKEQKLIPRAKRYFITTLTLESLRADTTGHSGSVCIMDELSSFISGQNQYKSKGDDRETWLAIYDGNPGNVARAKEDFFLLGTRLSLFGGTQPDVWRKTFGGDDGLFLVDGTVFRFLVNYESYQFFKLTAESWSDLNREIWEQTLMAAMEWSDEICSEEGWKSKSICLNEDAKDYFFDWRNNVLEHMSELPDPLKGFLPKITGAALRLAGVLYCMDCFSAGTFPGAIINLTDIKKGIDAVMFYMGQTVDATQSICSNKQVVPFEITDQVMYLAETLESLRDKIDSGRLAVGYIQERFNERVNDNQKMKTAHPMGALIRKCGLTIPVGHFRANKKTKAKCLLWDKKTDSFLKQVLKGRIVRNGINHAGLEVRTLKNQKPHCPQKASGDIKTADNADIDKSMSSPASLRTSSDADKADKEDIVSKEIKQKDLPADVKIDGAGVLI